MDTTRHCSRGGQLLFPTLSYRKIHYALPPPLLLKQVSFHVRALLLLRLRLQTANKNLLHDLTECEKLAEDERDALQQTLHATRTEKQRVSDRYGERQKIVERRGHAVFVTSRQGWRWLFVFVPRYIAINAPDVLSVVAVNS